MATWYHSDYADGGPDMLRTRAATSGRIRLRALGSYTDGDSYATVAAATLGFTALAPVDITSSGALGATRTHTLAAKTIALTAGDDGTNMHWAITDETDSKVLIVGPATSNTTPIESGGTLMSAAVVILSHAQP